MTSKGFLATCLAVLGSPSNEVPTREGVCAPACGRPASSLRVFPSWNVTPLFSKSSPDAALTSSCPGRPAPRHRHSPPCALDASGCPDPAQPAARTARPWAEPRSGAGAACPLAPSPAWTGMTPVSAPRGIDGKLVTSLLWS